MDKPTQDKIMLLHPSVRVEMTNIIKEINSKLTGRSQVRISQGLRTFAEQDALFNKKPKVTNAANVLKYRRLKYTMKLNQVYIIILAFFLFCNIL